MGMFRLIGLFAIIPTTMLLTVSFFVLFTVRRTEPKGLKVFGYVISALLWLSALLVFSAGVYTISTGRHPMMPTVEQMMGGPWQKMMMEKHTPGRMQHR